MRNVIATPNDSPHTATHAPHFVSIKIETNLYSTDYAEYKYKYLSAHTHQMMSNCSEIEYILSSQLT